MSTPLIKPTKGESLYVWRRRSRFNQSQAAKAFKRHVDVYRDWEADRRTKDQPYKPLGALKLPEVCVLRRRRAGLTQRELASRLGCTRLWIIQMESGEAPLDRLRQYWGI